MRELSLFTGAGGGVLGSKLLGWTTCGYVEINDYCQKVIAQRIKDGHLDEAPIFGDIRAFISEGYAGAYQGMVDVVTGGFPCQDISIAGKGEGITGERSGLWGSMAEVIGIIRPKFVFVENSPMLTSRGLGTVLWDLARMGFNARWGVLGASHVGGQHARKRIWILAYTPKVGWLRWWMSPHEIRSGIQLAGLVGAERVWETSAEQKARVLGVGDGMAYGMDRLEATGNGQVPIVAATAFRILSGDK